MIFVRIQECLRCTELILTAEGWGTSKLDTRAVEFKETEGASVHHQGEDLAAYVHEHDATPFVWVREIA
jgi:hypothetical protein